jgi:hypothetical protein
MGALVRHILAIDQIQLSNEQKLDPTGSSKSDDSDSQW